MTKMADMSKYGKIFNKLLSRAHGPMVLKLGMYHWILQYYYDYSNYELGLTLLGLTSKSKYGQMLEHKISWNVLKFWQKKLVYSVVLTSK